MAYEQKELSGALFKNKDKTAETPKWADYQGKATIDGVLYYISAWLKEDKNGDKYMSLAFKLAEQRPQQRPAKPSKQDVDSDIPFDRPFRGFSSYVV